MKTIPVRPHIRRLPERQKLMDNACHTQLWHEFVGNVLSLELADILPKWAEQDRLEQFEEDMQTRVREGG